MTALFYGAVVVVAFVIGLLGVYAWLRSLSMLLRQQDQDNRR